MAAPFAQCATYADFINREHGAVMAGAPAHDITVGADEWVIFGTKWGALNALAANSILSTNGQNGNAGAAPAVGEWGALSGAAVAAGINPGLAISLYSAQLRLDEQNTLPLIQGMPALPRKEVSVIVGKIAPPGVAGALHGDSNVVGRNLRMAQLSLPDAATNIAARDLVSAISSKTFTGKLTIFLNADSICCKIFYDFICKMTDIIYDKSKIDIWMNNTKVVSNGVKTAGAGADLKCDGVALTCKNGLSTAKHSVFTEELSYMYSEVVRLMTNHTNMLNSGFLPNVANGGPTPLETALNKFKNFLTVLLRYDYMITGNTDARKERFRLQAAHALYSGKNWMAPNVAVPVAPGTDPEGYNNYLFDTSNAEYNTFFTNLAAANAVGSFFTAEEITLLKGCVPVSALPTFAGVGSINPSRADTMCGMSRIGAGDDTAAGVAGNPAPTNAGGLHTGAPAGANAAANGLLGYHCVDAVGMQMAGPAPAVLGDARSHMNSYTFDMSISGAPSAINWTCERIAQPKTRYGIDKNAANAGATFFVAAGAGAAAAAQGLSTAAKGLNYKEFMLMLILQLMAGYDAIINAERGGAARAIWPAAGAPVAYPPPDAATSLLARTYYMDNWPAPFACAYAAAADRGAASISAIAPPNAVILPEHSTPIAQSIVRYVKSCLS
jgi:hypothetical protein